MIDNDDAASSGQEETFSLVPQIMDKYETRFWGVQQSELYKPAGLVVPSFPIYHPYHPFSGATEDDTLLQVPLAMSFLNFADVSPQQLLEQISEIDSSIIQPFFVVQTLPYLPGTPIIARYQYGLFPDGKCEMKGFEAMWAQSFIYDDETKEVIQLPATQIKIYESRKNETSPTILCGNTMELDTVENIIGKGLWSLVLGSPDSALRHDGIFSNVTRAFIGYTHFIVDGDEYNAFLEFIQNKSPQEISNHIPSLIEMGVSRYIKEVTR